MPVPAVACDRKQSFVGVVVTAQRRQMVQQDLHGRSSEALMGAVTLSALRAAYNLCKLLA